MRIFPDIDISCAQDLVLTYITMVLALKRFELYLTNRFDKLENPNIAKALLSHKDRTFATNNSLGSDVKT